MITRLEDILERMLVTLCVSLLFPGSLVQLGLDPLSGRVLR